MIENIEKKKVHIISLGCVKNTVDSEIIAGGLERAKLQLVDDAESADTVIINTCGFIGPARQESVDVILETAELKKTGHLNDLLVAGCLSARYMDELKAELPEVDAFFKTEDFENIFRHVAHRKHLAADPEHLRKLMTPGHYAYLKISEGCDNVCSFCSIPIMRGKQRSRTIDSLVEEATTLAGRGVKELMVIAQDTTTYGWDLQPKRYLHELLTALDDVEGFEWIRLHYAHPSHFSRNLIPVFQNAKRLLPYIDMPVQHGSTRMLTAMKRGLDNAGLRRLIRDIKSGIPDVRLRTSIVVGFPGETDEDFDTLMDFLEEVQFDRVGVFTYSEEEGTSGAELEDDVPEEVKLERQDALMNLQYSIAQEKNDAFIGQTLEVLIDRPDIEQSGTFVGRTRWDAPEIDNIVYVEGPATVGAFEQVKIHSAGPYELYGDLVKF
ncbi:MAG: 30S ribosomal protein S12 methylthiotransferase RimO [Candidatus Marinimicrobia bacterium]|nr:30S ribosomal protein S12 methylthiotransferase RimO [Candidatus Neomarinimicrobiota bacterium]MCF7839962.1 30S ribosomal protein S12 methylthiotransferase RimO [Candidatus Neomarinimicrobiota bacterium]